MNGSAGRKLTALISSSIRAAVSAAFFCSRDGGVSRMDLNDQSVPGRAGAVRLPLQEPQNQRDHEACQERGAEHNVNTKTLALDHEIAGQWTINAYLSDPAGTPSLAKIPAPTPVD